MHSAQCKKMAMRRLLILFVVLFVVTYASGVKCDAKCSDGSKVELECHDMTDCDTIDADCDHGNSERGRVACSYTQESALCPVCDNASKGN